MLIDTLTAKLTADASGFTPVMERAGQQLRGFGAHGESASHGLTLVRRGFEALAVQATGVSGPIGHISSGLLMLGPGSQAVLGVAAGIGVIAGAYKLLSSTSTELIEKNNKIHDSFVAAAQGANVAARAALDKARADLGVLEKEVRGREQLAESARLIRSPTASVAEAEAVRARTALATQINLVNALEAAWRQTKQEIVDANKKTKEHAGVVTNELSRAYENFADKISDLRVALQLLRPSFLEQVQMVRDMNLAFTQMMARQGVIGQAAPQLEPTTTRPFPTLRGKPQFVTANGVTAENPLEDTNKEMEKELKERGAEIGAAFIMAMAQGAKNASDFLKQVMLEIANIAIVHIFKLALGIASPSRVGIDLGKNFSYGLATGVGAGAPAVGGASGAAAARMAGSAAFSLNLSGMPPAMNPLAAARDQEYQRFFREGALVAKAAGFQFS